MPNVNLGYRGRNVVLEEVPVVNPSPRSLFVSGLALIVAFFLESLQNVFSRSLEVVLDLIGLRSRLCSSDDVTTVYNKRVEKSQNLCDLLVLVTETIMAHVFVVNILVSTIFCTFH